MISAVRAISDMALPTYGVTGFGIDGAPDSSSLSCIKTREEKDFANASQARLRDDGKWRVSEVTPAALDGCTPFQSKRKQAVVRHVSECISFAL
jgi:hypothetical protein